MKLVKYSKSKKVIAIVMGIMISLTSGFKSQALNVKNKLTPANTKANFLIFLIIIFSLLLWYSY